MDNPAVERRLEVRFDEREDWGRGLWVSHLYNVTEAADFVAGRGKAKTFDSALLVVAVQTPRWGEPRATYDGAQQLPEVAAIMASHKDWSLVAELADGKWTASFLAGGTVVGSFTDERAYEAIIRAFDGAIVAAGGAWWGDGRRPGAPTSA
ncbi:MAG: hypothetical protein WEB59_08375 [Thermoanaerobaculia bacterium]